MLQAEQKRLRSKADEQKAEMEHLMQVAEMVEDFQQLSARHAPTLDECRTLFARLRADFSVEYKLYGLDALARASVVNRPKSVLCAMGPAGSRAGALRLRLRNVPMARHFARRRCKR